MFLWLNLMAANDDIAANGETTNWELVLQAGESVPVDLERQRPYTQEPCEHCDGDSRCITRGANAQQDGFAVKSAHALYSPGLDELYRKCGLT